VGNIIMIYTDNTNKFTDLVELPDFCTLDLKNLLLKRSREPETNIRALFLACTVETNEIVDPDRPGDLEISPLGFAEYAEGEAERTFTAILLAGFKV